MKCCGLFLLGTSALVLNAAARQQSTACRAAMKIHAFSRLDLSVFNIRGGGGDGSIPRQPQFRSSPYQQAQSNQQGKQPPSPPQPLQQPQSQLEQQDLEYPLDNQPPPHFQEETFQNRVDNWRTYQAEHAKEQRSSKDPRDEQGRMKLLTSVSKGSRAITFFILMWRNVHLYEVVDQKFKGSLRLIGVFPLTILFVANLAGVVASITSAGHSSKKRLKAILNLDKLMEVFLILSNIFKLLFSTSNLVPRELYISQILHSVFFIIQCQTVTRFVWDEALPVATRPPGNADYDNEYSDYEPRPAYGAPPYNQQPNDYRY